MEILDPKVKMVIQAPLDQVVLKGLRAPLVILVLLVISGHLDQKDRKVSLVIQAKLAQKVQREHLDRMDQLGQKGLMETQGIQEILGNQDQMAVQAQLVQKELQDQVETKEIRVIPEPLDHPVGRTL